MHNWHCVLNEMPLHLWNKSKCKTTCYNIEMCSVNIYDHFLDFFSTVTPLHTIRVLYALTYVQKLS